MTDIVLRINELLSQVVVSAGKLARALYDARAEIIRLRAQVQHYEHQCELGTQEIERLRTQNEHLRLRDGLGEEMK